MPTYEPGYKFVLQPHPDPGIGYYGIPEEEFGVEHTVLCPYGQGEYRITTGPAYLDHDYWYVFPEMMGPAGGPW